MSGGQIWRAPYFEFQKPWNSNCAQSRHLYRSRARGRLGLYFDQDSCPVENFRSEIESVWASYSDATPLAIVGSNYFLSGKSVPRFPSEIALSPNYVLTDSVITSGSLYNMAIMSKLGPFKDEFFIDGVDIEYCWRALANGYGVCRTTKPLLEHVLGAPTYHVFWGRSRATSNHRAFRRYFMMRNAILIFREYFFRLPRLSLHLLGAQLRWVILLCAYEKDRRRKLSLAFLGLWHGLIRRVDPEPWRMIS